MSTAVIYARVSSEKQAGEDKVSIESQLADGKALCEQHGWQIADIFVDKERYRKTKPPDKGRVKEPSGKYDDRPAFMRMLETIETGQIDHVIYWDNYRFGRHERVLGSFTNSLDIGNAVRNGRGEIQIWEASKGAIITRMVLGIMTQVAREENEAKNRRVKLGKIGTLQQGRWPGTYWRYGYEAIKEKGKRGRKIILVPDEAEVVKKMFSWAEAGLSFNTIRKKLIAMGVKQKENAHPRKSRKYEWSDSVIGYILHSKEYTGYTIFRFSDGDEYTIEIPRIIEPDQWERVQKQIEKNKVRSERNAKTVFLLKNILYCAYCNHALTGRTANYHYRRLADGTVKKYKRQTPRHNYSCYLADRHDPDHPSPLTWNGVKLDYAVWRYLVDHAIKDQDEVINQIYARQAELQAQGDDLDSEIERRRRRLAELDREELNYARQQARGQISEQTFDILMAEVKGARNEVEEDLAQLVELRDDAAKVQAGVDYAKAFLSTLEQKIPEIDQTPEELNALSKDKRDKILKARREIIRALCDKVIIHPDGQIKVEGLINGTVSQFDHNEP